MAAAAGLAVVLAQRAPIAERLIVWQLARSGVSPVALHVTRLDARGIDLRDLALGAADAPDLAVGQLEAAWSARGLLEGRLDAVRLSALRLRGAFAADGLRLGAADPLWRGEGGTALLPRELELRDARLVLETPQGIAEAELSGALRAGADGALGGELALGLEHPLAGASGTLALSGTLERPAAGLTLALRDPRAGAGTSRLTGRVEARAALTQEPAGPELHVELALRDVGLELESLRIAGVSGAITLQGPPLHTPEGQLLSIAVLDPGVPLSEGLVEFQLLPDAVLAIRKATWKWAGGELRAEGVTFAIGAERNAAVLQARGLDLGALLALVDLEGLEATGRVDGELPILRSGTELRVDGAVLRAGTDGGTIHYRPSEAARGLAASRPHDLGLAIGAFADFRYEVLEARLDGDLAGEMKVGLHVRGANPGFQQGRPIELNLNLEARLADLARSAIETYRLPEAVEERLRAFSEKEGP